MHRANSPCARRLRALLSPVLVSCLLLPAIGAAQEETRQLVVERIQLEGNTRTRPQVIFRYLTVAVGETVDPDDLLESQQRLARTRFFARVEVYAAPGSQKGQLVVVVEVEEWKWPRFRFEGGSGELEGWYIVPAGFNFDNFAGWGQLLDWKWKVGDRGSRESLHYQHPYLFDGARTLDLHLFGEHQVFPHYIGGREITQQVESRGTSLRFSGRGEKGRNAFFSFRSQRYEPDSDSLLAAHFGSDFAKKQVVVFAVGLEADTRDHRTFPLAGFWGEATGELAPKWAGSDAGFARLALDVRIYRRIGSRNVLAGRGYAGYAGRGAPFFERFYLGGPYSLRGYSTGRLTPVGWGTKLFLVQTEIRFPLSEEGFPKHRHTGVVYCDAGGIWLPGEVPGPEDLHLALGVGYRLRMKVLGILRIDFSLPVSAVDENDFRFQLSLGNAF